MKRVLTLVVSLILLFGLSAGNTPAQEDIEMEEEYTYGIVEYTYGIVVRVSRDALVISEYDEEADVTVETTYWIDLETAIYGVDSLLDLVEGDEVDIDYILQDENRRVATVIGKVMEEDVWDDSVDADSGLSIDDLEAVEDPADAEAEPVQY